MTIPTATASIEREARELRGFFVRGTDDAGELQAGIPEAATVEFAFAQGLDRPEDFTEGAWSDVGQIVTPLGAGYIAKIELGGPDTGAAVELAPGEWIAYVRVTTTSERPVIVAGTIVVK